MEFVEAALHEIDEEFCRDDFDELCYVARMGTRCQVNLITPRCTCDGNVSRRWYGT